MNLSPRNRLIVVAVVAAAVVVALAVALVMPQITQLGAVGARIKTAEDASNSAGALLEQRRQVRSQAALTDAKLIQLAVAVPENPDLPSLIIDLQDTAYDSGVVIMSVQPADPVFTEGAAYVGLPITAEIWGTWSDTVDFLQQLQRMERELRTAGFTVEVLPVPEDEVDSAAGLTYPPYYQVRSTIRLTAYVIPAADASSTSTSVPTPQN